MENAKTFKKKNQSENSLARGTRPDEWARVDEKVWKRSRSLERGMPEAKSMGGCKG